ncbi:14853_t:CDS:1, partial [Cetraspora pellucida]
MKLKQIIEKNVKYNVRIEKLEQKNKKLKTRLAIAEHSSVAINIQAQNNLQSKNTNAFKE